MFCTVPPVTLDLPVLDCIKVLLGTACFGLPFGKLEAVSTLEVYSDAMLRFWMELLR